MFAGGFALFLSASGQFLPHDIAYLGMTPEQLCALERCRVVDFMVHDRVAFGGTLIGVGALYIWLAAIPLRLGQVWAWWVLIITAVLGFGSFLTYLGYGYLDTWHGVGTLLLLPVFVAGMVRARSLLPMLRFTIWQPAMPFRMGSMFEAGRLLMLAAAGGMFVGGLAIMWIGVTDVFVPQDLEFMGSSRSALDAVNPRLVPLLAHDRAGFGGGVATTGLAATLILWWARPSRSLWEALAFSWLTVSAAAIGIHVIVGYDDVLHLAPAVVGAAAFGLGLLLTRRGMFRQVRSV